MQTSADAWLANIAAQFMNAVFLHAQQGSDPAEVENVARLHDQEKLYPRLTVTANHGGGQLHIELVLCDPGSGEAVVRMFDGTAIAMEMAWQH